ncbi:gustatory receptor for bitter taste 66a isoform X2 [Sitodiplosis mosellana]|uniref:gustatory receptor for bitter taste 66a isoform X2 n=1 Tax=Sitodiplosis mosellana TaxID=263140 RepID=UPI002443D85C|nr:gustatory receptor for bitter taste 66a isoform X2 [Sitodiplosis mosellana]
MAVKSNMNFSEAISYIFYVTKLFGLIPYSLSQYRQHKILVSSYFGNILSIAALGAYVFYYHYVVTQTYFDGNPFNSGTLTTIIGIFILYMEPIMMTLDMLATLINQRHLVRCIQRLEQVDEKLAKENVQIDYRTLKRLSLILIIVTLFRKFLMMLFGFFVFELNVVQLWSMYVPICVSVLSKIFFVLIVCNIRKKFDAINSYLDELANSLNSLNENNSLNKNNSNEETVGVDNNNVQNKFHTRPTNAPAATFQPGYLQQEIVVKPKPKFFQIMTRPALNLVKPFESREFVGNIGFSRSGQMNDSVRFPINEFPLARNGPIVVGDKFDKRLTNLCFLHDEICEIVGIANYMFSFQMLMLMAYGFLGITAQLYFVYCGLANQPVPRLFRSAENIGISSVLIISTAVVCVYVIYVCWQTKNSAEKTGVFLHKLANIVDENHFYETINHLSLKLLNHQLNFTACGFFDLDMTTIYAITGAITSYLIILIQFNVAAQRSKKLYLQNANNSASPIEVAIKNDSNGD